jgi:F-type H+-transporting ATPase subunit gamma
VEEAVFAALYRAFAESLASEHARRLATMQSAERSIDERLEELEARYHQLRQASITQELLEGGRRLRGAHGLEGMMPGNGLS